MYFSHDSFLFRSCGTFWRSHRCQNIRLIPKIFRSHLFNVLERYCVHIMLKLLVIIEAQSVEFVERAMITERVVALIGDFLLANQFLFRSRQFLRREAIVCELVNFIKQRGFYRLHLLWGRSEVKCENTLDHCLAL